MAARHEMKLIAARVFIYIMAHGLVLMSSACGFGKSQQLAAGNNAGLQAFQIHVLPVQQQNCTPCHATTQAPLMAIEDVAQAYSASLGMLNMTNPAASSVIARATDNHNGKCSGTQTGYCEGVASSLLSAYTIWAQIELESQQTGSGILLAAQPIPANVSENNPTTLTYSTPIQGVTFTVDVRLFGGTDYLISAPTLITPTKTVYIKSVRAVYNGSTKTTWASVNTTVVPPQAQLSSVQHLLQVGLGAGQDMLAIRLEKLSEGGLPCSPEQLNAFTASVSPLMQNNCVICHGGANPVASTKFLQDLGDQAGTCSRALSKIDSFVPANSLLLQRPLGTAPHPVQVFTMGSPEYETILDWILMTEE